MRVIPVIDVRHGIVVHAVRGDRIHYQPVVSTLAERPDPLAVARAFQDRLGLRELYVADLDALESGTVQWDVLERLVRDGATQLMVDAGVTDVESARRLLDVGVHRVVVGSETLRGSEALMALSTLPPTRRVFSLDLRTGQVLSRNARWAGGPPWPVLDELLRAGWTEVIVLDLVRVGTQTGPDTALLTEVRRRYPGLTLLAGGGVRHVEDLRTLEALGVDGVLVATALHRGTITAAHIRDLQIGP
ncbi:1-(5-phosphoribosyl)-5-[(5-phosphoribosylamino) methylideneamino] imidazole-4-carboxamide isomerase [bacterium HR11]|nr:1-(5-phosphoribosyl)-5-[(5-phosphoribosylamino) methylideneamino] imidazole-4-carboxamide isomerase [bacterium HR11]